MAARPAKMSLSRLGLINICISLVGALATYFSLSLMARQFGGTAVSDAYFYLISLTTIFTALIASVLSAAFLPVFIELKVRHGMDAASQFGSIVLSWCLVGCLLIGVGTFALHDAFFATVSKFGELKLHQQRSILIYFAPVFCVSVMSEYFRLVLIALGGYTVAALGALLPPVILVALLLYPDENLRQELLALSLLASKSAVLLMLLWMLKGRGIRLRFVIAKNHAATHFLTISAPYASAGLITHFATFFFDYMATGLGVGILTSTTYAQRLFAMPVALIINPLLEIARARFSEYRALNDMRAFQLQYENLVKIILYFSISIAVIFFCFSREIVEVLFQRGAFSDDNVGVAANCLQLLSFSVPATCLFTLNGRTVESFQRLVWPSFFGTIGNIFLILLTFNLVTKLGYKGIPYARVAIDLVYFLPFGFLAAHFFGLEIKFPNFLKTLSLAGTAAAIPILIYLMGKPQSWLADFLPQLWVNAALIASFLATYLILILLIDRKLFSVVRKLLKR